MNAAAARIGVGYLLSCFVFVFLTLFAFVGGRHFESFRLLRVFCQPNSTIDLR